MKDTTLKAKNQFEKMSGIQALKFKSKTGSMKGYFGVCVEHTPKIEQFIQKWYAEGYQDHHYLGEIKVTFIQKSIDGDKLYLDVSKGQFNYE